MFKNEQQIIEQQIHLFCVQEGIPEIPVTWKWIPFSGHWGISTSFFQAAALEARQGKNVVVAQRAQEIAEQVVRFLGNPQGFSRLEAVNGYLNLYFSTGEYAQRVVDTVLQQKDQFGKGEDKKQKVMVEFSQPNTHKAFHVGHLRNVILGDAACRLLKFSAMKWYVPITWAILACMSSSGCGIIKSTTPVKNPALKKFAGWAIFMPKRIIL
jgi:arginyl-tRNA synthetase